MAEDPRPPAETRADTREGPDGREPHRTDRRGTARGGRRATDALTKVADFVYKLLTEPPR